MARPQKLSEVQLSIIRSKMLKGEKLSDLANEYGVDKSTLSRTLSKSVEKIKEVGQQMFEAKLAVARMPLGDQVAVEKYVTMLDQIQNQLGHAAHSGAKIARIANDRALAKMEQLTEIDKLPPDQRAPKAFETMGEVHGLSKIANEASVIARSVLNPNNRQKDESDNVVVIQGGF